LIVLGFKRSDFNSEKFRYGFNGQERDKEIFKGGSYNFTYRMHRPDIGRFFGVDPLFRQFPMLSSYQFAANTPISSIDLEGLESFVANKNTGEEDVIKLTLINAEDAKSVIWSERDKETKTDPLQIIEIQKFISNVVVNKKAGIITLPNQRTNRGTTDFYYTKFQKDSKGGFAKDNNGNLIPVIGQMNADRQIAETLSGKFGIELAGGRVISGEYSDTELIDKLYFNLPVEKYDKVDVYVKPSLIDEVKSFLGSVDGIDMSKVDFKSSPQKGDNSFELIFKQNPKPAEDIE
jgi:RHS repeat-associated protein